MPQTATQTNRKGMNAKPQPPKAVPSADELATEDQVYGLVSVLYHALQGAETTSQYIADAESAGDDDLVRFFEQCRDQDSERAKRAKALLASRLEEEEEADEDDDEDDDETSESES